MIDNEEHRADLIKFAKKLKFKRQSFPQDENGEPTETYLEYLSIMYNSEIIKTVLELPVFPDTMSIVKLAKKINKKKKELIDELEPYVKKGYVIKLGRQYAQPMPLFIYDMPFILKEVYSTEDGVKLAQLSRKFFVEDEYYKTWETSRSGIPRLRVITVSEEVEHEREIIPIEEVYCIIDQWDDFAVIPCPCRNRKEIEGIRECKDKYPIHNCIMMGSFAKAVLEMGDPVVRAASKEEIKKIVREASDIGLIHGTDNDATNTRIICNCCECCCGMLAGLTRLDNPRSIAKANFISYIDRELCVGCETCLGRCKFGAITVNDVAEVNTDKCVGCGLCAVTCPEDAITMKRELREEIPGAEISY
ncbi:MAG: ATP-binding protein [Candidatus Hodarchaeota archaeon]